MTRHHVDGNVLHSAMVCFLTIVACERVMLLLEWGKRYSRAIRPLRVHEKFSSDRLVLMACLVMTCLMSVSEEVSAQGKSSFSDAPEWKEQDTRLPAYPNMRDLLVAAVSGDTRFEFRIDPASIEIGSDGVVRFVVVAQSPGGAVNVSYEGIRCSTRERRIYGVGRPNGTWSIPFRSDWVDYRGSGVNAYHEAFAQQYFCVDKTPVSSVAEIVKQLKRR